LDATKIRGTTVTQPATRQSPQVFFLLFRLHQQIRDQLAVTLSTGQLTMAQYTTLSMLRSDRPVTVADLARELPISAQSLGETIKILEEKGFVEKRRPPGDSKRKYLALTDTGRKTLLETDALVLEAERNFLSVLPPDNAAGFVDSMRQLRKSALG